MQTDYLTSLLGCEGYQVKQVSEGERQGRPALVVDLQRREGPFKCGKCRRQVRRPHSNWLITVQHLAWWQYPTILRLRRYRINCPVCGLTLEAVPFLAQEARVSRPLAVLVAELCKVMTIRAVAALMGLHWGTVKALDKLALVRQQATRPLDGIDVLGVDELSVGSGQHYWHLVSALEGPRGPEMLWVGKGRKERSLCRFWRWFGKDRAQLITHAVMDMWKPFRLSFLKHCPGVSLLYDKFHIMQHLLKALNDVRKAEFHKAAGKFRGMLAGKKFILLSRAAHVRGHARIALNQLLGANRNLLKAHLLKESFGHLWSYRSRTWAMKFFRGWVDQLKWSRLKPFRKFVRLVEAHWEGILAYCDRPVSLGFIESANLKARNVIRQAYGYRDEEYCMLKIIQACTPWMREFQPWASVHN